MDAIVLQPDGKILVGGSFLGIGGQSRPRLARLDPHTGLADSFNPNCNGPVSALALQVDGKILVGGNFFTVGGQYRYRMARLDPGTGAADSFNPEPGGNLPTISTIVVQPDSKILVGGKFSSIGGQPRNQIARLDPASGLADSFNPDANGQLQTVASIVVQPDGKIITGGSFSSVGGQVRNHIARLETDGRLDQTLAAEIVNDWVFNLAVQPDGKIIITGNFTTVHGVPRNRIARLNADGSLDTTFTSNAYGEIYSVAVQPDGKILVGGAFTGANSIGGQTRNYLARLEGTTGLADSFAPNPNDRVGSVRMSNDGKILVSGGFATIGGQNRNRIARVDPITGLADAFNPDANSYLYTVTSQLDGKVLFGGFVTSVSGQTRNGIARVEGQSGALDSFNPNASSFVHAIVPQGNGKILVAGNFDSIGGQTRRGMARLDSSSGLADSFNANSNSIVHTMVPQSDGKIIVSGYFSSIGGQGRGWLARLDGTTALADSFAPAPTSDVFPVALQADGKVLVGGYFQTIAGQPRKHLARLTNDTAAFQELRVRAHDVTWTRGGSAPNLERAVFEYSSDNVSYTPLGDGVPVGAQWTLANANFPRGETFYVRARGYYSSGQHNTATSITDSVRVAFISPPSPTRIVSRKMHGEAGTFGVHLPVAGAGGVECRSGGANGEYQLVVSFAEEVTLGGVSVTSGVAQVASFGAAGKEVTVNLAAVADAQTFTVRLSGIVAGMMAGDLDIPVTVLIGDVNGDRAVNSGDAFLTRSRSGALPGQETFRSDLNADGSINTGDAIIVRARSGSSLP